MSAIEKLFPASPQERSFQLKARRDAGTAAPNWVPPQFVACKKCGRRATRQVWTKSLYVCPNCGVHLPIGAYYRLSTVLDHGTFKELNLAFEEKFGVTIADEDLGTLKTVGDIFNYLAARAA